MNIFNYYHYYVEFPSSLELFVLRIIWLYGRIILIFHSGYFQPIFYWRLGNCTSSLNYWGHTNLNSCFFFSFFQKKKKSVGSERIFIFCKINYLHRNIWGEWYDDKCNNREKCNNVTFFVGTVKNAYKQCNFRRIRRVKIWWGEEWVNIFPNPIFSISKKG